MVVDEALNRGWMRRCVGRSALESFWLLNEAGARFQLGGCGLWDEWTRAA